MTIEHIRFAIDQGVATLTLNRPEKLNAITPEMAASIQDHCAAVDRDDAVRVLLIEGAGERAFCAGSDLGSLAEYSSTWKFRNRVEYSSVVRNVRKPVITALKGWVLGGGAEIALASDIRVAATSTRCGFPEVTRGWVGGGGASQMLPRVIGYGHAMRLLLMGEPIDAPEAFRLGLLDVLVPDAELAERALAIARRIAGYSGVAVEAVKASVRASLTMPLDAGLRYENEMNTLCFSAGDHLEGIHAFQQKRSAQFER